MIIVLRLLSVFIALNVALTIWAVVSLVRSEFLGTFLSSGLGKLTLAGWVIVGVVGPFAAVQLWRLRESGRRAAIVCTAVGVLYYIVGSAMYRTPQASAAGLAFGILSAGVPLMILVSPRAKRACAAASAASSTPSS